MTAQTDISSAITIRPIQPKDIQPILMLDRVVTFEFFKPLFEKTYERLGIMRSVVNDMEEEIAADEQTFTNCAHTISDEKTYIAYDEANQKYCGFITFHKVNESTVEIDLFMIDTMYRNRGIGKKLVHSMMLAFENITTYFAYVVQFFNDNTIKFYESLGFKNLGIGPTDRFNSQGLRYSDFLFHYQLDVK